MVFCVDLLPMRKLCFLIFCLFFSAALGQNKGLWIKKISEKNISLVKQNGKFLVATRKNQVFFSDFSELQELEAPFVIFDLHLPDTVCVLAGEGGVAVLKDLSFEVLPEVNVPIWQILAKDSSLWFIGENLIFKAIVRNNSVKILYKIPLRRRILGAAVVENDLWVNLEGVGLHILQGKAPVALPYAAKFQALPFANILKIGKQKILFGYNHKIYQLQKNEVRAFTGKIAKKLTEERTVQAERFGNKIAVLTAKNSLLLLDSSLQLLIKFRPEISVKHFFPFEEHILLATSEGVFLWKPGVNVVNVKLSETKILNMKFVKGNLFVFTKKNILVFNSRLEFLKKVEKKGRIFTDVNEFQGKLIFSSNEGLWKFERSKFTVFLPKIPVLNFRIYGDTFALRLLDTWIFAKKVQGKWTEIQPQNPAYYLREGKQNPYPFLFDFLTKNGDTLFYLYKNRLFAVQGKLNYKEVPLKIWSEAGKTLVRDYYFQGRIRREQGRIRDLYFQKDIIIQEKTEAPKELNLWKYISFLLVLLLLGWGVYVFRRK